MVALLAGASALFVLANLATGQVRASAALLSPLPSPTLPISLPSVLPTLTPPPLPKISPTALPKISPPPTSLPSILPTALPSILPSPRPSPTLPISVTPSPSLPPVGATPTPTPTHAATGSGGTGSGPTGSGGGGSGSGPGWHLPLTGIVISSPLDAALLAAFAVLPLLLAVWMLLAGRTWTEAQRSRDAQIRLAIANDLGLSPRELTSVTTKGLFKLREEAAFDEMTGVLRRAAGVAVVEREVARARRQKTELTVAFLDLDGLKEANDKLGHKAGDELIRGLSKTLQGALRGQDAVFRYGGDEFVCVLPDTSSDAARAKLSWVQTEAEKAGIRFSLGVAGLERSDDVVSLLGRADSEMYAVKARNHKIRDIRLGTVGGIRRETA